MIDIPINIANILKIETDNLIVTEIIEFIGDAFHTPEVYGILQNICYRHGIDAQDFMGALDDLLVKIGLN